MSPEVESLDPVQLQRCHHHTSSLVDRVKQKGGLPCTLGPGDRSGGAVIR